MSTILFQCDYNRGAHPRILERLADTNHQQFVGYGEDDICDHARQLIREACQSASADVHFLVGGTQTNVTVIDAVLRPHQGVVCATTGHINVHETGAVEHSGHKCLAVPTTDGKLTATQVAEAIDAHHADPNREHMVQPAVVYISLPTELGSVYTLHELEALSRVCHDRHTMLFVDGARLGYGLASDACDITLADLARLSDIFYIGGTKQGALFGEAVVIAADDDALRRDFRYHIKQNGAMLAKGWLLGLQFETLFTGGLYFELSRHAIVEAGRLRATLAALHIPQLIDSPTNQLFPILPDDVIDSLSRSFGFDPWGRVDDLRSCIRICTSWGTSPADVDSLIDALRAAASTSD